MADNLRYLVLVSLSLTVIALSFGFTSGGSTTDIVANITQPNSSDGLTYDVVPTGTPVEGVVKWNNDTLISSPDSSGLWVKKALASTGQYSEIIPNPSGKFSQDISSSLKTGENYDLKLNATENNVDGQNVQGVCFYNNKISECPNVNSCLTKENADFQNSVSPGETASFTITFSVSSASGCKATKGLLEVENVQKDSTTTTVSSGQETYSFTWSVPSSKPTGTYSVNQTVNGVDSAGNAVLIFASGNIRVEKKTGGGGDSRCTDNNDNDGDTKVDENDDGCISPYQEDNSEANIYDLDASWVFSGGQAPDSDGPSVFYGWKTVNSTVDEPDLDTGGGVKEAYIQNPGTEGTAQWGGGDAVKYSSVSAPSGGSTTTAGHGYGEIIDAPQKGKCGDGRDDGENNIDCPEDVGLPDDSEGSSLTMTDVFGTWNMNVGNSGDDTKDTVENVYDLEAAEASGSHSDDITSGFSGDYVLKDQNWQDVPDFLLGGPNSIKAVYPRVQGKNSIGRGSVTDYDLQTKTYTNFQPSSDTEKIGCSPNNKNSSCSTVDPAVCTDNSEHYVYDDSLNTGQTTTLSETTHVYRATGTANSWSTSDPTQSLKVTVTYDGRGTSNRLDAYNCGAWDEGETCVESSYCKNNFTSCSTSCSFTDTSATEYKDQGGTYQDFTSRTRYYYYQDLTLTDQKVFDINPIDSPASSPGNPKAALFQGDTFKGESYSSAIVRKSSGGEAYWAYDMTTDNKDQGNDRSTSITRFDVAVSGSDFVSSRQSYNVFDADGSNGQSDGYVAIKNGEIAGSTNNFLSSMIGMSFGSDYLRDTISDKGFLNAFNWKNCGPDKTSCVASIDLYMENVDQWTTGVTPESGVRVDYAPGNPYPLGSSLGTCMMYKKLTGSDAIQCMYDGTGSPAPNVCGDDDTDGDGIQDEFWAYMEGQETDESSLNDYPENYQGCIGKPNPDTITGRVGSIHSCVYNGSEVKEGFVANVTPNELKNTVDQPSGYEEGGPMPDYEVCLDINLWSNSESNDKFDYDNDGIDEDVGGEWYDLDNEKLRGYLNWRDTGTSDPKALAPHSDLRIGFNKPFDFEVVNPDKKNGATETGLDSTYDSSIAPVYMGLAMEDDCHPELAKYGEGCDDTQGNKVGVVGTLFRVGVAENDPNSFNAFTEEANFDEYPKFNGSHNSVQVLDDTGGSASVESGHGYGTNQSMEVPENSPFSGTQTADSNSKIDSADDEWGMTPGLSYAIANNGSGFAPYSCYGVQTNNRHHKGERVYANSIAAIHEKNTNSDPDTESVGVWEDPDNDPFYNNASCDLTQGDFGVAFDTGSYAKGNDEKYIGNNRWRVWRNNLIWDVDKSVVSTANSYSQDVTNLPQHKNMCGDDYNEFVIRDKKVAEQENLPSGKYTWACADRRSDCVFSGEVYSEGALVDVSTKNERGPDSVDKEVCLDINRNDFNGKNVGGEFYDLDNESIRSYIIYGKNGSDPWENPNDPSTYHIPVKLDGSFRWNFKNEVADSPFNPLDTDSEGNTYDEGYALEDDCDPDLGACDDSGGQTSLLNPSGGVVYSNFSEGDLEDDSNVFNGIIVRTWIGQSGSYTHTSSNPQDDQNTKSLEFGFKNNSEIDVKDDTWAIADRSYDAVGPRGEVYDTGKCYEFEGSSYSIGDYDSNGYDNKTERIMANSYSLRKNVDGDTRDEGVWVDPDTTERSINLGGISCDLRGTSNGGTSQPLYDWGYGFDKGDGSDLQVVKGSGAETQGFDGPVAVKGDIQFDTENNIEQFGERQDESHITQYPPACGDDRKEYLIREHEASNGAEFKFTSHRKMYVCADRPTDCAFNGKVYSQGQTVDVSSETGQERGDNINDPEVCLDLDKSVPGGEWYDLDNDWLYNGGMISTGLTSNQIDQIQRFAHPSYWGDNPGTDRTGEQNSGAPTGYATEDDCDPDLKACDDMGNGLGSERWFNAGNFSFEASDLEGAKQDNFDSGLGYKGVHNRMQDRSNQYEDGARTSRRWTSGGYTSPTDINDSTPGPDNWSLSNQLQDSVSNNGTNYAPGQCYYRGVAPRNSPQDGSLFKNQKIFGNSYADAVDMDNDGTIEGVWRDPDDLSSVSKMKFSCDLTGPDKGYGYNTDSGNPGNWYWKNTRTQNRNSDSKIVIGDIVFATEEDVENWKQEPDVCGDDAGEFLVEELGEVTNSAHNQGRWGCSTAWTQCVSRSSTEGNFFDPDEKTDTNELGEEYGRLKNDKEICKVITTNNYGEKGAWFDQDYKRNYCNYNTLYGPVGIRWIDKGYVNQYPAAVKKGIDDDMNQLLEDRGEGESSPVSTGVNVGPSTNPPPELIQSKVATRGFCGGDDSSEYLLTQDCSTRQCETDRQVIAVGGNPDSCVIDGSGMNLFHNGNPVNTRKVFIEGEKLTRDVGVSKRSIACFDGTWFSKWPVVFEENKIDVGKGETRSITFKIINVAANTREFRVTLGSSDVAKFAEFQQFEGDSFTTTVKPRESKSYQVEIYGGDTTVDSSPVKVTAETVNADVRGTDSVTVDIVKASANGRGNEKRDTRNVPGIGLIHILVIFLASSIFYMRQS